MPVRGRGGGVFDRKPIDRLGENCQCNDYASFFCILVSLSILELGHDAKMSVVKWIPLFG